MASVRSLMLLLLALIHHARAMSDDQYKVGIKLAMYQAMLSQKLSKEYFLLAKGVGTTGDLMKDIDRFDAQHAQLVSGGNGAAAGPVLVQGGLAAALKLWTPFKNALGSGTGPFTNAALTNVMNLNLPLLDALELVIEEYIVASETDGHHVIDLQAERAGRELELSQKVCKEAVLIALGIDVENNFKKFRGTMEMFMETLHGVLEGVSFMDVAPTTNMCTLKKMRDVGAAWEKLQDVLEHIMYTHSVTDEDMYKLHKYSTPVLTELEGALDLYFTPITVCPFNATTAEWKHVLEEAGVLGMHSQKAARLFFQIAFGVNYLDSQVLISDAIVSAHHSIRYLTEGSEKKVYPSPVSQTISASYNKMYDVWLGIKGALEANIFAVGPSDFGLLADVEAQSVALADEAYIALHDSLAECHHQTQDVPCEVISSAVHMRTLFQQVSKEAILVAIGKSEVNGEMMDQEANLAHMLHSMHYWEKDHHDLIHGHAPYIPTTSDVCILQQMKKVEDLWLPFKKLIMKVANGDTSKATLLKLDQSQWNSGHDPMADAMTLASKILLQKLDWQSRLHHPCISHRVGNGDQLHGDTRRNEPANLQGVRPHQQGHRCRSEHRGLGKDNRTLRIHV